MAITEMVNTKMNTVNEDAADYAVSSPLASSIRSSFIGLDKVAIDSDLLFKVDEALHISPNDFFNELYFLGIIAFNTFFDIVTVLHLFAYNIVAISSHINISRKLSANNSGIIISKSDIQGST